MVITDSFLLAFKTVRSNKLRTGITVTIIALGIMALIGIITAKDAMNQSFRESFASMGANAFSIRFKESRIRFGRDEVTKTTRGARKEKKSNLGKVIRKEDAEYFKQSYTFPATVSMYIRGGNNVECYYGDKKTNPQETIWGGDENYLAVNGYEVDLGRNLSSLDVESGRNVCLIGSNTAAKLFGSNPQKCIDKIIRVGGMPYRVIGLLKSRGNSGLSRQDDVVITSYNNARRLPGVGISYLVGIMVSDVNELDGAIGEATSVFRGVRKLTPMDEDNFVVEKSDKFAELLIGFLGNIAAAAVVIGMITLAGAAIGLMNIMLVAVSERTREVGLIKALGGKRSAVRQQFLFESMIISLLGALFGIILGILVGNLFGVLLHTGFVIPWGWVIIGIVICSGVGLLAGLYPAIKASRLNPIVALRYE